MLGSKQTSIPAFCLAMLIPITRETFDFLIPRVATADQYRYCWGKSSDFLRRLLISVVAGVVIFILRLFLGEVFNPISFVGGTIAGLYWFWSPVYVASRRNAEIRRNSFAGFWRGRVLDVFVTDDVTGTEETVNNRGDLVIVENRERRLNLEIGDRTGFSVNKQVPLKRNHRVIRRGDYVEMLVLSNREDLSRINMISDLYIPDHKLWVSDYPYLRRDTFIETSRKLQREAQRRRRPPQAPEPAWDE